MLLLASLAFAADTWTIVAPGIDRLTRTTADPNRVHAVVVDLGRPEIWLRATKEEERQATVSSWAGEVGATVAINGDWFSYTDYYPVGLAIGGGWGWHDDTDAWSFLACNVTKECWIDPPGNAAAWTPRAWNAVGGNGVLLVIDGVAQVNADAFYSSDLAPRSAVGISADGQTLYLVVVDGRSSSSEGMTFNQMGALLLDLGAHDAMMFDGGGSSTLWVEGSVVNTPSEGSQRTVSNHFGVMVSSSTDSRCTALPNGKYCLDGTRMATCEGGTFSEGDCGYYGLACEESESFAYCVDPSCTNGGQASFCVDATVIGTCTDGVVTGTGDCAYYGATCEDGACVLPGSGGDTAPADTDTATDTDPTDTDTVDPDTNSRDTDAPGGARPGTLSRLDGLGCGCDSADPIGVTGIAWFASLVLVRRRRSKR
jgi:hypothetical protein